MPKRGAPAPNAGIPRPSPGSDGAVNCYHPILWHAPQLFRHRRGAGAYRQRSRDRRALRLFHTQDGEIALAPSQEESYQRLIDALDLSELREDPRFRTNGRRVAHRAEINQAIEARLQSNISAYWIEKLNAAGVPCDRVMTLSEVFVDPQVRDQEMALTVDHPGRRPVTMLGFPLKFAEAPCTMRRPAPDLGADTAAVLGELGYAAEEIARLRAAGIV